LGRKTGARTTASKESAAMMRVGWLGRAGRAGRAGGGGGGPGWFTAAQVEPAVVVAAVVVVAGVVVVSVTDVLRTVSKGCIVLRA
jgi:hypothetical protein